MTGLRIGSLFSGAGMLDEGVRAVVGGDVAWHAEVDPAACRVLEHRYPQVPNLGDVTDLNWTAVPAVDVLTGGSPCQDVSHAGRRAGMRAGTRSGLWAAMCDAIDILRPALVVWENVRGVLSAEADSALEPCPGCVGDPDDGAVLRALGRVLGDLAGLGYDTRWCGLRAADVGAPHGRFRVFVTAWPAQHPAGVDAGHTVARGSGEAGGVAIPGPLHTGGAVADAADVGHERHRDPRDRRTRSENSSRTPPDADGERLQGCDRDKEAAGAAPVTTRCGSRGFAAADTVGGGWDGRAHKPLRRSEGRTAAVGDRADLVADASGYGRDERRPQPARLIRRPDAPISSPTPADADQQRPGHIEPGDYGVREPDQDGHRTAWGPYAAAIERWQRVLGRPAPAPTETAPRGGQRLSPRFVEWLMGWPEGWVTDVPAVTRNDQLKICGNGVVPQQAAAAIRLMLGAAECAA